MPSLKLRRYFRSYLRYLGPIELRLVERYDLLSPPQKDSTLIWAIHTIPNAKRPPTAPYRLTNHYVLVPLTPPERSEANLEFENCATHIGKVVPNLNLVNSLNGRIIEGMTLGVFSTRFTPFTSDTEI